MTDDAAGSYSSGGVGGGGGNDWELVSLTASTYAAAPGPVLPVLLGAHNKKTDLPPPTTPAAVNSAIFMSQHFSLPAAAEAHSNIINGCQEEEEEEENSAPAMLPRDDEGDTGDLNIPCQENRVRGQDGGSMTRRSDFHKDQSTTMGLDDGDLFAEGGEGVPVCFAGEERQATTLCSSAAADAATADGIIDSAFLPAHVVHVAVHSAQGVARVAPNEDHSSSIIPCEARAWWNKTFRFLRDNSKESLTFRFILVAATIVGLATLGQRGKLQLRLEFNVDSEKISCGVGEPLALGQVKANMLAGSPVAQG